MRCSLGRTALTLSSFFLLSSDFCCATMWGARVQTVFDTDARNFAKNNTDRFEVHLGERPC